MTMQVSIGDSGSTKNEVGEVDHWMRRSELRWHGPASRDPGICALSGSRPVRVVRLGSAISAVRGFVAAQSRSMPAAACRPRPENACGVTGGIGGLAVGWPTRPKMSMAAYGACASDAPGVGTPVGPDD